MKPALEWITDTDTPNALHLYRDGQWFGSVGRSQMNGEWDIYRVKNGEPHIVGCAGGIAAGKRRLEWMATR